MKVGFHVDLPAFHAMRLLTAVNKEHGVQEAHAGPLSGPPALK